MLPPCPGLTGSFGPRDFVAALRVAALVVGGRQHVCGDDEGTMTV